MPDRFMHVRSACLLFVAVAGLLLGGGCNTGGSAGEAQVEVTRRVQRGVTPGQRPLVFDHYSGDITLQDTSAREADLTFIKRARAQNRNAARKLLSRIRIEERGGGGEFAYKLTSGASARTSVDVRGHVPDRTHLRVYLRNGEVALSGLRGPLEASNENGDIRIGGAARSVRAETRNGAVEVGMRRVAADAEVRLQTQNGDLRLTLPASASAEVEARTDAGEVDVGSGLRFSGRELDASGAGARFEGELGEGTAQVRLRTANGDITLRQGTVRRLPGVASDTTQRDTTRRDSLLAPPPGGAGPDTSRGGAIRDTGSFQGAPPMLRDTGAATGDTSAGSVDTSSSSMPMLPSSPGRDTVQRR